MSQELVLGSLFQEKADFWSKRGNGGKMVDVEAPSFEVA